MSFIGQHYQPSSLLRSATPSLQDRSLWRRFHIDPFLLSALLIVTGIGLAILYSASNGNKDLVLQQIIRLGLAYVVMIAVAQIPPHKYKIWVPWVFIVGVLLLIAVLFVGDIGKGARRWLDLGVIRFQPSEIMKLAIPIFIAWYLQERPLPPSYRHLLVCAIAIV
ncbi:MAG: FtsW/RodA/SpoVE family cell cycle protein, partial [Gammaproteobacteria bacterium]|nr:FtsW/RodA/SpoVE family cell cycle protein [Gammaproteobacteria bacterium]